jgi:hypothetical protein
VVEGGDEKDKDVRKSRLEMLKRMQGAANNYLLVYIRNWYELAFVGQELLRIMMMPMTKMVGRVDSET